MATRPRLSIAAPPAAEEFVSRDRTASGGSVKNLAHQGMQLLTNGLSRFERDSESLESRYELGEILGRGAYSVVRAVTDRRSGERLAAKVIAKSQFSRRPAALRRLRDEACVFFSSVALRFCRAVCAATPRAAVKLLWSEPR